MPQQFEPQKRFDPDTAQQIIARAADLQQKHLETISTDQLEILAAEVGLSPEFVRQALQEHENEPVPTTVAPVTVAPPVVQRRVVRRRTVDQRTIVTRRDVALGVASAFLASAMGLFIPRTMPDAWPIVVLGLFSILAALGLGFRHPSRRLGAALGGTFGFGLIMAILMRASGGGDGVFAAMLVTVASGAALGLIGAALRRIWNRLPSERDTVIEEIVEE